MADEDVDVVSHFRVDTSQLNGLAGRVGGIFGDVAKAAAGAFIGLQVVDVIGDSISEAREALEMGRQTDAVLKSMGPAAGVTSKNIGDLANSLSQYAGVDDEAVQSGENMLLTFGNIQNRVGKGNDIFNQASRTIVDYSARFGGDIPDAAVKVGKALNDPINGITALTRVGVAFTEQQKTQIRTMQEHGDVAGAQKIVLAELARETGGAAGAAADPMKQLDVTVKNLEETFGLTFLPVLNNVAGFLSANLAPAFDAVIDVVQRVWGAFQVLVGGDDGPQGFGEIMDNLLGNSGDYVGIFRDIGQGVLNIASWFNDAIEVVQRLWGAFSVLLTDDDGPQGFGELMDNLLGNSGDYVGVFRDIGQSILDVGAWCLDAVTAGRQFIDFLSGVFDTVAAGFDAPAAHFNATGDGLIDHLTSIGQMIRGVIDTVVPFVTAQFAHLVAFGQEIFPPLQEAVGHVFNAIRDIISVVLTVVMALWQVFGGDIKTVVGGIFDVVKAIVQTAVNTIANVIRLILDVINGDWGKAWQDVKNIFSGIWDGILGVLQGAMTVLRGVLGGIGDFIRTALAGLWASVVATFNGAEGWLKDIGSRIIDGLIRGIKDKFNDVKNTLGDLTHNLTSWKGPADVDARLLTPAGESIMGSLVEGFRRGMPMVQRELAGVTATIGNTAFGGGGAATTVGGIVVNFNGVGDVGAARSLLPDLTSALRAGVGAA